MNFYSRSSGSGATGQNVGALLKVRNPRVGSLAPKLQRYGEVVKYPLIDLSFGLQHRFDPKIRLVDEHPTQKFIVNGLVYILMAQCTLYCMVLRQNMHSGPPGLSLDTSDACDVV